MGSGMAVVFLDGEHADKLAAAVVKFAEFAEFLRRKGPNGVGTTSAKWAMMAASMVSVLASWPMPLAKSRTWRALTTTAGRSSASKAPTAAFW